MGKTVIAYPLKKGGSNWNNGELRASLRSVEMHWKGGYDMVSVYGSGVPAWVNRNTVNVVEAPSYMDAWRQAMSDAGDGGRIIWMNDDISFVKDTCWEDLLNPVRRICPNQVGKRTAMKWAESSNGWRRRMGIVMQMLIERGHTTFNFASHTPYAFEVDKLRHIFDVYGKLGYKLSVECAYYNTYLKEFGGTVRIRDKYRTTNVRPIPDDLRHIRFINLCDGGLGPEMKGYMQGRFPNPSKFEMFGAPADPVRKKSFKTDGSGDKRRPDLKGKNKKAQTKEEPAPSPNPVDSGRVVEPIQVEVVPAPQPVRVEVPKMSSKEKLALARKRAADLRGGLTVAASPSVVKSKNSTSPVDNVKEPQNMESEDEDESSDSDHDS
jgi:hypothetical protein